MWSDHQKRGQTPLSPIQENAALGDFEQGTKFFYGCLLDLRLNVEILLRHLSVSVPHKALNRLHVHALCLKLAHIGVPAGVGCKQADTFSRAALKSLRKLLEFTGRPGTLGLSQT